MFRKKNIVLFVMTVILAGFIGGQSCSPRHKKDYNVVVIVIDALRSDHLPIYGYKRNTAPFISELAKKGIVFENAFAASSWTSPATASIFTSLYPYQHGVLMGLLAVRNAQKIDPNVKIHTIPPELTTMTEMMKANGYQTYGAADNLNIDKRQGFTQGFDKFRTFMYRRAPNMNDTVKNWREKMISGGKYFLYLHYMEPHAPYHANAPWFASYGGKLPNQYSPEELDAQDKDERQVERRKNRIAAYDSEINYVDQHIKELYELFQWDKNTVLIITADHGEGLWDHGLMGHGKTLFREEIQVPLLVILPDYPGEKRIPTNASNIDIFPTIRDYLKLNDNTHVEGKSLIPLIENNTQAIQEMEKRDLYSHLWVDTQEKFEWKSTIYKQWHFLMKYPDSMHLYFIKTDPKEQDNKIAQGMQTAQELNNRFDQFRKTCPKSRQITHSLKLDKKETDKLKSLGYIH